MSNIFPKHDLEKSGEMINFGIGRPSADLLPLDLMQQACEAFFREAEPNDISYGSKEGDVRFVESLATFLGENYGQQVRTDSLLLSGGVSQALDFICTQLSQPSDIIIVEEPCYFLAYQIFKDHGLNIITVPIDEDGMDLDVLETLLSRVKPTFVYTIPTYQNPSGRSMSTARRKRLIALSQSHDFLIVADEVYQLLSYHGAPPAAFGTMLAGDTVLSVGSFSKILAPGLRLGWIQTSNKRVRQLTKAGLLNSGGSINQFTSMIVKQALDSGLAQNHLSKLRTVYRDRVITMDTALREQLSDHVSWTKPEGGYFFWLKLIKHVDVKALNERASALQVEFHPGTLFSNNEGMQDYIRLSFAYYGKELIRNGIDRLKTAFE
ncbi:MAG: PLP-dependent aminotransferase family protein [Candidatus Electrothrix sp. AX5]|nr:PLP-dependent aminotransferase family protein [Candidatus Electrothrix sp. AX5]